MSDFVIFWFCCLCSNYKLKQCSADEANYEMDFAKICRSCLQADEEVKFMFSFIKVGNKQETIADLLDSCFKIKITHGDGYPEQMCLGCVSLLTAAYSFKNIVEESANTLSNYKSDVKNNTDKELSNDYEGDPIDYSDPNDSDFVVNNVVDDSYSDEDDDDYEIKKEISSLSNDAKKDPQYHDASSEFYLRRLQIKQEPKTDPLYCTKCTRCDKFNSPSQLLLHCKKYHKVTKTSGRICDYCNERFDEFPELIHHRKMHFSPYVCGKCWVTFVDSTELDQHTCVVKPKEDDDKKKKEPSRVMRQCDQCGKSYPAGYIKVHMLIHGDGTYQCKYCFKRFKQPCSLNSHVLWNHKKEKKHKCEECGAVFVTSSSRNAHYRKNHLQEKKHGCETCEKKFFSASDLKRHMFMHTDQKNYHCNQCDKSYRTRYGLKVHFKSHKMLFYGRS